MVALCLAATAYGDSTVAGEGRPQPSRRRGRRQLSFTPPVAPAPAARDTGPSAAARTAVPGTPTGGADARGGAGADGVASTGRSATVGVDYRVAADGRATARRTSDGAARPLRVFVLPHSHDDVGWIQTPPDYYEHWVRDIYTSVAKELALSPTRHFQCVEQYYFQRWWLNDATAEDQAAVRRFVAEGRFQFAVGGWVMPDEATTDYADLIETMTAGHEFIMETFGVAPLYGFQVDPFGSSSVFAAYSALMGFNAHIIDRIDYWTKSRMQATQQLEFVWTPSSSLPNATRIFTHIMDQYGYGPPYIPVDVQLQYLCAVHNSTDCPGGNYLWDGDDSHPASYWQFNPVYPPVNATSVDFYSTFMVNNTKQRAAWFGTDNLLWCFGSDFQWFNATRMYHSMDQIIEYVNDRNGPGQKFEGVTLQYASLSDYFEAVHEAAASTTSRSAGAAVYSDGDTAQSHVWPVRGSDDFLPYTSANGPGPKTWTGYYTSHSQLKGKARSTASYLRSVNQLYTLAQIQGKEWATAEWEALQALRQAVAVLQHHDAVTGTEGPGLTPYSTPGQIGDVVQWYTELLNNATAEATPVAQAALGHLLQASSRATSFGITPSFVSQEAAWQELSVQGGAVPAVVWNPVGWTRSRWLQLPVPVDTIAVTDALGHPVPAQITPTAAMTTVCRDSPDACSADTHGNPLYEAQPFILHFLAADLPPAGARTFIVVNAGGASTDAAAARSVVTEVAPVSSVGADGNAGSTLTISNQLYHMQFDTSTGLLVSVTSKLTNTGTTFPLTQQMMRYTSFANATEGSVSGSYVFHPAGPATSITADDDADPTLASPSLMTVTGPYVQEVWQTWAPNVQTVFRLYHGSDANNNGFIEVDHGLGPLAGNEEVITRFTTQLCTSTTCGSASRAGAAPVSGFPVWYGDNNGQQVQRRVSDANGFGGYPDESYNISANYAPMVRSAYVVDEGTRQQFSVMSSRSHGASSQANGELEVMLHRRELQDDGLGACYHPTEKAPPTWKRPDGCPANRIPLNVTSRVYPRLWLAIGDVDAVNPATQRLGQLLNNGPQVMFGDTSVVVGSQVGGTSAQRAVDWVRAYGADPYQALADDLPDDVHLLTLESRGGASAGTTVVRLQHLFDAGASVGPTASDVAAPVAVASGLGGLLRDATGGASSERSLTLVRSWEDVQASRWQWSYDSNRVVPGAVQSDETSPVSAAASAVAATVHGALRRVLGAAAAAAAAAEPLVLQPQQIRTFTVQYAGQLTGSGLPQAQDGLWVVLASFAAFLAFVALVVGLPKLVASRAAAADGARPNSLTRPLHTSAGNDRHVQYGAADGASGRPVRSSTDRLDDFAMAVHDSPLLGTSGGGSTSVAAAYSQGVDLAGGLGDDPF